ncbi:86e00c22-f9b4-4579-845f-e057fce105bf [Sclerotinia trifoliorum]|uniref:86e00c22-f9b4-4579-845f-e057fce105bf n=1 Tax=Sclerotinia trifoliorum TaxID=28548 RepID=A0A8H2VLX0_9HELO|nr:86e00c22-f9b4-4579-845f-e057fce105bf [Sclerotinia trifoliorum]
MTETSAVSRVFSIPELLHEILSYLPQPCLLLTVQLVCKNWAIALTSPSLGRALWFRPAVHNGPSTWSSLLEQQFGVFFDFSLTSNRHVIDSTAFDNLPWKRNLKAFKRADASWRDMLVFQPPAYEFAIERIKHDRGGLSRQTVILPCPDGLRMGMVWDIAQEWCLRRKHWLQMTGPEDEKEYRNSEVGYAEPMIPKMILHWHITCPRRGSLASLEDDWVSRGRKEFDLFQL